MSRQTRIQTLRSAMQRTGVDALFVTQPLNVYYLSGYRCRSWSLAQPVNDLEAFALVQPDKLTFICDDRHDPAPATKAGWEHGRVLTPGGIEAVAKVVNDALKPSARTLGFEAASILHSDALGLMKAIDKVRWQAADELVARQRVIKDDAELDLLKHAAHITDGAFAHIVGVLRPGMSEQDVANEIGNYLRRNSEGLAFDTIVGFGPASAAPHYHPSPNNKLKKGDLVLMDFGAVWEGYHGDMTRCVFMGKADARQREVYEWVLGAQEACLKGLKPGMTEGQADSLARGFLETKGCVDRFIHGTGHGLGLAIHELPRLKPTLDGVLEPGMVVTVEPGLYFDGWGGIRIEDVAVITRDGHLNITHAPKQLMEIPC